MSTQSELKGELIAPEKARAFLLKWRERYKMSQETAALLLRMDLAEYLILEEARAPMALSLFTNAIALTQGRLIDRVSLSRERWVDVVDHALRYRAGEPIFEILRTQERWQALQDLMRLMKYGPRADLALTDPFLFRHLREAATDAFVAGELNHPEPPFEELEMIEAEMLAVSGPTT